METIGNIVYEIKNKSKSDLFEYILCQDKWLDNKEKEIEKLKKIIADLKKRK